MPLVREAPVPFAPPDRPRRLPITADQFETLIANGLLPERNIELIAGELIEMPAQMVPHTRVKMAFVFRLKAAIDAAGLPFDVASEGTVRFGPNDAPQPDVFVYGAFQSARLFPASAVRLAVEVCETTHRIDLRLKPRIYAVAAIPEYWVADLRARTVEQFWRPENGVYAERRTIAFGQELRAATLPITVATDSLD